MLSEKQETTLNCGCAQTYKLLCESVCEHACLSVLSSVGCELVVSSHFPPPPSPSPPPPALSLISLHLGHNHISMSKQDMVEERQ